jgi:hypothetical protein
MHLKHKIKYNRCCSNSLLDGRRFKATGFFVQLRKSSSFDFLSSCPSQALKQELQLQARRLLEIQECCLNCWFIFYNITITSIVVREIAPLIIGVPDLKRMCISSRFIRLVASPTGKFPRFTRYPLPSFRWI